ncbi:universal stress protein [Kitasatospora sp. NPDC048545]|uniref:universal stress protein n=1 Tax=Kitasatospora sp. NPDC048545 TaxID=3157208 RepID=UPI0033C8960D
MSERSDRVVVGVDGSAASRTALDWAVLYAAVTRAVVDAVIAWQYPVGYGWPAPGLQSFDFEDNARQALTTAVSGAPAMERIRALVGLHRLGGVRRPGTDDQHGPATATGCLCDPSGRGPALLATRRPPPPRSTAQRRSCKASGHAMQARPGVTPHRSSGPCAAERRDG